MLHTPMGAYVTCDAMVYAMYIELYDRVKGSLCKYLCLGDIRHRKPAPAVSISSKTFVMIVLHCITEYTIYGGYKHCWKIKLLLWIKPPILQVRIKIAQVSVSN